MHDHTTDVIFCFVAKSEEKDRSKHEKKAEEKAAKQEKKREKEANKNKKALVDHSNTIVMNNSMNTSSTGASKKLYDDELDPTEEFVNECEMSSGIQMMTFRTTEVKGKIYIVFYNLFITCQYPPLCYSPAINSICFLDGDISREKQLSGCFNEEPSNESDNLEADTQEKVEELIQKKRLPQDQTIAIHSPESGTTFW